MRLVPNALHFIDKYNQVPRILNPMVLAIEGIDRIARDPFVYKYIEDAFGGVSTLKKSKPPPSPVHPHPATLNTPPTYSCPPLSLLDIGAPRFLPVLVHYANLSDFGRLLQTRVRWVRGG